MRSPSEFVFGNDGYIQDFMAMLLFGRSCSGNMRKAYLYEDGTVSIGKEIAK